MSYTRWGTGRAKGHAAKCYWQAGRFADRHCCSWRQCLELAHGTLVSRFATVFVTVSPDDTYTQRGGRSFDLNSPLHRSLLVSGPLPMPFGADPNTNLLLLERGADLESPLATSNAKLYAQYCGFIDDKTQAERAFWRGARLCNSGNLQGDLAKTALAEFHDKADSEIANYRSSVIRNAAEKLGTALSAALALLLVVAAGMWVAAGRLL